MNKNYVTSKLCWVTGCVCITKGYTFWQYFLMYCHFYCIQKTTCPFYSAQCNPQTAQSGNTTCAHTSPSKRAVFPLPWVQCDLWQFVSWSGISAVAAAEVFASWQTLLWLPIVGHILCFMWTPYKFSDTAPWQYLVNKLFFSLLTRASHNVMGHRHISQNKAGLISCLVHCFCSAAVLLPLLM